MDFTQSGNTYHKAEAVDMLTGQYAASIAVYDENEIHTLEMADVMAEGIIKQFNIY